MDTSSRVQTSVLCLVLWSSGFRCVWYEYAQNQASTLRSDLDRDTHTTSSTGHWAPAPPASPRAPHGPPGTLYRPPPRTAAWHTAVRAYALTPLRWASCSLSILRDSCGLPRHLSALDSLSLSLPKTARTNMHTTRNTTHRAQRGERGIWYGLPPAVPRSRSGPEPRTHSHAGRTHRPFATCRAYTHATPPPRAASAPSSPRRSPPRGRSSRGRRASGWSASRRGARPRSGGGTW